jgi:hypothetical protein
MLERVLWPRGRRMVTARPLARRVDTLAGKTVAQVWDDLFRREIFPMPYRRLREDRRSLRYSIT